MTIICEICKCEFNKQINNKHLKYVHGITPAQYKEQFPNAQLISEELRLQFSKRSKLSNESRKNVPRTESTKKKISEKNKGNPAWNKGQKVTDPEILKKYHDAIKRREERYKNGELKRSSHLHSKETKNKLREYAIQQSNNTTSEQRKAIVEKALRTSLESRERRKLQTNLQLKERLSALNFELLNDISKLDMRKHPIVFTCKTCGSFIERNSGSILHEHMCSICHYDPSSSSKAEIEIAAFIRELNPDLEVHLNNRYVISPLEIDIWIPEKKVAIEFCGLYWHSEKNNCNRFYHRHKFNCCNDQNIKLIQIFEDEWIHKQDIVKNRIEYALGLSSEKIYARKCIVKEITKEVAKEFLDRYHLQGYFGCTHRLGLFFGEDLVSVMTFSKPNYTKGNSKNKADENLWEIGRFCSSKNVVGGAAKIFQYFIKNYNANEIYTYADLRWGNGDVYSAIGMQRVKDTYPNYWYIDGTKRIHRYTLRKTQEDDKKLTEWEIRKSEGWNRIWDCGSAKYVWQKN